MISQEPNDLRQQELYLQETQIEMDFLDQKRIFKTDLISSTQNLAALASLHRSVVCSLIAVLAGDSNDVVVVMVCSRTRCLEGPTSRHIICCDS